MQKTTEQKNIIEPTRLVGQCFHSIEDERICWQGQVIGSPEPGWYLVQLYEWVNGSPSHQRLAEIKDMRGWLFYDDHESMIYSWEHGSARHFNKRQEAKAKGGPNVREICQAIRGSENGC